MRVLAISGSQLKKGNTSQLIGYLTGRLEKAGISDLSIRSVSLSGLKIRPCKACKKCMETGKCVVSDDFGSLAKKMLKSDLIIIGSPVYFHDVSGEVKNLIDRTYSLWHERQLKGKRVIPVAVCAETGDERTLETLRIWAQSQEMRIVHSVSGHGYKRGEVMKDEQALASANAAVSELTGEIQRETQ